MINVDKLLALIMNELFLSVGLRISYNSILDLLF